MDTSDSDPRNKTGNVKFFKWWIYQYPFFFIKIGMSDFADRPTSKTGNLFYQFYSICSMYTL